MRAAIRTPRCVHGHCDLSKQVKPRGQTPQTPHFAGLVSKKPRNRSDCMTRTYDILRGLRGYFSFARTHAGVRVCARTRERAAVAQKKPRITRKPRNLGRGQHKHCANMARRRNGSFQAQDAAEARGNSAQSIQSLFRLSGFRAATGRAPLGRGRTDAARAYRPTSWPLHWPRAAFLGVGGPRGAA